MRVAIAGLGTAALQGHLPAAHLVESPDFQIVAGADPDKRRRALVARQFPHLNLFDATEDMLACGCSDVLVVAASPFSHADLAERGLQHEQHVVCEKPLILQRAEHERLQAASAARPHLALIPVHQFRYARSWQRMRASLLAANALRRRFRLEAQVERAGTDKLAVGTWRDEPRSGGLLADHGTHLIALANTITRDNEVLGACRTWNAEGRELASACLRVGSGSLRFTASAAAPAAHTRLRARVPGAEVDWNDGQATLRAGRGQTLRRWDSGALSDRRYTDALYRPFYADVSRSLPDPRWRRRRTDEGLCVAATLVALLEIADKAPCGRQVP